MGLLPAATANATILHLQSIAAQIWLLLPGTILKLGTKVHHDQLLKGIDDLGAVGCFALTELGYGVYFHSDFAPTCHHQICSADSRLTDPHGILCIVHHLCCSSAYDPTHIFLPGNVICSTAIKLSQVVANTLVCCSVSISNLAQAGL